jgi:hypothetical protein
VDVKAAVSNYLISFPSLTALIGSGTNFRLYPDYAPENSTTNGTTESPFIVYRVDGVERPYDLNRPSGIAWGYY